MEAKEKKVRELEDEIDGLAESLKQSRLENQELCRKVENLEAEKKETEVDLDRLKSRVVQVPTLFKLICPSRTLEKCEESFSS